jgi:hypothetical protein
MNAPSESLRVDELRRRKALFDNTWMVTIVFSAATAIATWYLGISQADVQPVVWLLVFLTVVQFSLSSRCKRVTSPRATAWYALAAQFCGLGVMGCAWHLFGGLQQPIFPLFSMLPLFAGALLLSFWQRQAVLLFLLFILLSGVVLTPDTNSFITERYGMSIDTGGYLPGWVPRSRVAFSDVTTTPAYDIMLTATLALLAVALSTVSGAIVVLFERSMDRTSVIQDRLDKTAELNQQIIRGSPCAEALVHAGTGRVIHASDRFAQAFSVDTPLEGSFFLDALAFSFPAVIKRLMAVGGEEIQGALVDGHEKTLRVRAGCLGSGDSLMTRLIIEPGEDIIWKVALDALEEAFLIINAKDEVVFLNRAASELLPPGVRSGKTSLVLGILDTGVRWWDIAPLDSARRLIDCGDARFLASIRRKRVVESLGEFSFVHLHARASTYAVAAS